MPSTKTQAGVAPEVNLRNPLHTGDKECKQGIESGFENQGICHQKGVNDPKERTYVP